MSDSLRPHALQPARLLCPWASPGKNTGVGCHSLARGIFLTQGLNPGLLHYRQILYHLSLQGSPLEGNIGQKLHNIEMGNNLLDVIPSTEVAKDKLDKLDFMKIKNFGDSKDIINRIKRQFTERKKRFANCISK